MVPTAERCRYYCKVMPQLREMGSVPCQIARRALLRKNPTGWLVECDESQDGRLVVVFAALMPGSGVSVAADLTGEQFREKIQPILEDRCFACHGNGNKKGGVEPRRRRIRKQDCTIAISGGAS